MDKFRSTLDSRVFALAMLIIGAPGFIDDIRDYRQEFNLIASIIKNFARLLPKGINHECLRRLFK